MMGTHGMCVTGCTMGHVWPDRPAWHAGDGWAILDAEKQSSLVFSHPIPIPHRKPRPAAHAAYAPMSGIRAVYRVQYKLRRRGKLVEVTGGCFASAEAAALSVARMPEAQVEALRRTRAE